MEKQKTFSQVPIVLPVIPPDVKPSHHPPLHPNLPQIDGPGGGALLLMVSPVKTGKCLHETTPIETQDSGYIDIKDVKIGQYVNSQNGFIKVKNVFDQGVKDCTKIIINDNELILTKDHKLETSEGMKALKDIKEEAIITKNGSYHISDREDNFVSGACYDLEVDHQDHTFYSNDISVSNSTLISNIMLNDNFYDGQERFQQVKVISNTIANDVTSRFLAKAFDTHEYYSDEIIDGIVAHQKSFDKEDQPEIAVILDDCLGSIRREAKINHLASRFRHFNIKLLIISSQNFRMCSPIIRQNATNVIVGSPFPNQKELLKLAEEYGDNFGGADNWLKLYHTATPNRYDFLHMDFQANPPVAYHNFEKIIAVGGQKEVEVGNIEGGQKLNSEETK